MTAYTIIAERGTGKKMVQKRAIIKGKNEAQMQGL